MKSTEGKCVNSIPSISIGFPIVSNSSLKIPGTLAFLR